MRSLWIGAIGMAAACSFSSKAVGPDDANPVDASPDAFVPDAGACGSNEPPMCIGGSLRTCPPGGGAANPDIACAWGCLTTGGAHCAALTPTGNAVTGSDLQASALLGDITFTGPTTIDTDAGTITGGFTRAGGTGVKSGIDYQDARAGKTIGFFGMTSLVIDGDVTVVGGRALAIAAVDRITVNGKIDVRGTCTSKAGGPGGYDGGDPHKDADLAHGGGATAGDVTGGAGGGGHAGIGGAGGGVAPTPMPANPAAGGTAFGAATGPSLVLEGGGGGGGGGGSSGGRGGGGGGAVELAANQSITIGALGSIDSGGCGGEGGGVGPGAGGGGGGAGGMVVLEAAVISIAGSLAANGGGGGGGSEGAVVTTGATGTLGRTGALGGAGSTLGGLGAAGATADGGAGVSSVAAMQSGAGGGGAIGRLVFSTAAGTVTLVTGSVLSPALGETGATVGTASVH